MKEIIGILIYVNLIWLLYTVKAIIAGMVFTPEIIANHILFLTAINGPIIAVIVADKIYN